MQIAVRSVNFYDGSSDDSLFAQIAKDLEAQGYSINVEAMPQKLTAALWHHLNHMEHGVFHMAGIGRADDYSVNKDIRSDEICWITGESVVGRQWLKWSAELQQYLNRRLFLGLFSCNYSAPLTKNAGKRLS
jgi:SM-20-related protein